MDICTDKNRKIDLHVRICEYAHIDKIIILNDRLIED